ncbi:hypothetical protein ACFZCK_26750 [Kitasatospora purpeofusca]|uniref:hypothetical protein n=1 Tax=Kitasatospora purpeofusca TaxID=67352 RepID=UPI0036EB378D
MDDPRQYVTHLVDHYLGVRLDAAGSPAGLREAVIDLVTDAFVENIEHLMTAQLDLLAERRSQMPDAYLADQAAAEDALQQAAAGLRAALAQTGRLGNAQAFERGAAARLRDDPQTALRAELARVPRPLTRPEALRWTLEPVPWFSNSPQEQRPWPPPGLALLASLRSLPQNASAFARVADGPHTGWVQIGLAERQRTPAQRYPDQPACQMSLIVALEASDDGPPPDTLPISQLPWQLWTIPWRRLALGLTGAEAAAEHLRARDQPLVGLTDAGSTPIIGTPRPRRGPGVPPYVLAPVAQVIAALDLAPTNGICGFSLSDATGEALVCRQWRGHLVHDGNYEPLLPAVIGADIIIRPDLFTRLCDILGPSRCRAGINIDHASAPRDDELPSDED